MARIDQQQNPSSIVNARSTRSNPGNMVTDSVTVDSLQSVARQVRRNIVRMLSKSQSGHPGGSLSAVELLVSLYFSILRHKPENPEWPDRDRFILSKGHATPVLYSILAEAGYFPREELLTFRQLGSRLQGHVDRDSTPGVEMSGGSLGMGLSFGLGVALAARLDEKDFNVFVMMGDGECEEGQVWEAAMAAAHFNLNRVTAVIDHNKIQNDGYVKDIMNVAPLAPKWEAFGWHTIEIDGHRFEEVLNAYHEAMKVQDRPSVIIAHTVKGKNISFMENNPDYHGKAPTIEQADQAIREIDES